MGEAPSHRFLIIGGALLATAALAVVALMILNIGPFSDDTLTKGEFIAQGDEACRQARADFAQSQQTPPRTSQEAADLANRLAGIAEQELSKIRALNAPPELQPVLDEYLRSREQGIALLHAGADAAGRGDSAAYATAQKQLADSQRTRTRLAEAVGFTQCSRPVTATDIDQSLKGSRGGN